MWESLFSSVAAIDKSQDKQIAGRNVNRTCDNDKALSTIVSRTCSRDTLPSSKTDKADLVVE